MASAQPNKDTVYIDVDDEITTIIDKVRGSQAKIVALVLPKRAAVLQSIVNMKLLKRSAEGAKKQLVLITTETGLLPLAGSVGLYVADSLQSKPEIPAGPDEISGGPAEEALTLEDEPEAEYTADNAADKPVGELSKTAAGSSLPITAGVDTVNQVSQPDTSVAAKPPKGKKGTNKKLKVPSFGRFRNRMLLVILLLIILGVLAYLAIAVLPKAAVAITADASDVNSTIDVTMDTTASDVNPDDGTVPATVVQQQKTYSQQVDASGKQNNGDKATGSVSMTDGYCGRNFPETVPAGTGISTGGKTYITQQDASFQPVNSHGNCVWESDSVPITAQKAGAAYNVSDTDFSVAGRQDVSAHGSAAGGTDDIQTVVTQGDIDNAKNKIKSEADDGAIKQALHQQLVQQNLYPVDATFSSGKPSISNSANAGDAASSVTVTENVTYSMYGTNRNNLLALIKQDVQNQIDSSNQSILDDGLDKASFSVRDTADHSVSLTMESTATVGPKIDMDQLKQQIAGQKSGEAKQQIRQIPGVESVDVHLSPFWVSSIPKNTDKITVKVIKANASDGS